MKNTSIKKGTIYYTSWGYDQTNVEFYQVVEYKGAKTLVLKEIQQKTAEEGRDSSRVLPMADSFIDDKEYTFRVNTVYPKVGKYKQYARLHNGESKYTSWGR